MEKSLLVTGEAPAGAIAWEGVKPPVTTKRREAQTVRLWAVR